MNIKRIVVSAVSLLAVSLALGCQPRARVQMPDGFAALENQKEYAFRATSADGVVIGVRSEPNRPRANLAFWSAAIDQQLTASRYVPEGSRPVKSASGLVGKLSRYTRDDHGRTARFWVAVFVSGADVWLVEVGGDGAKLEGERGRGLEASIESLSFGDKG
jgi:hypothetical protein